MVSAHSPEASWLQKDGSASAQQPGTLIDLLVNSTRGYAAGFLGDHS